MTDNKVISAMDLVTMTRKELYRTLMNGHAIDIREMDNYEFKGISLGVPSFVDKLTWKKFKKVFHRDPRTGHLRGWNIRLEQNDLDGPCIPMEKKGKRLTFGHYRVVPIEGRSMPWPVREGLMIDYGLGGNGRFDPLRTLRDPIVAVNNGDSRLIIGYMYCDFGLFNMLTPSYFCLERDIPLTEVLDPPRGQP